LVGAAVALVFLVALAFLQALSGVCFVGPISRKRKVLYSRERVETRKILERHVC
jgi:hypothetical protein